MDVRFSKRAPWCCPAYENYYIQHRPAGRDIYGNETYEYALFRRLTFRVVKRFRTRKQAYAYVSRMTGYTRFDVKMGSTAIIVNDRQYLGVLYGETLFRIEKRTNEVSTRPVNDIQLSGWYMHYTDCVEDAKQIIRKEGDPGDG